MSKIRHLPKKRTIWHEYEIRKSILRELPLTAKEYEVEIKKIVKKLGI